METLNKNILIALLNLAQNDVRASVQLLAHELRVSRREIADALNVLAADGLIRGETCRLTFVGLMQASGARAALVRAQEQARAQARGARAA